MTAPLDPPIKVFLSYAHADDDVLDFIEPFSGTLEHLVFADRGRILDVFVDRNSIGWGEEWEDKIRASIQGAMVFMPIVTRQYFDSPSCREELLRFHDEARRLNVEALLLPIIVMGHGHLTEENPDMAVRIIRQRQCRDLREAWIEGPGSPVWRRTMMSLAGELVDAVGLAEQRLSVASAMSIGSGSQKDDEDDDAPGATEVSQALTRYTEKAEALFLSMSGPMAQFGSILTAATQSSNGQLTQEEGWNLIAQVAGDLTPHGEEFRTSAQDLESITVETDVIMRRYIKYLRDKGLTDRLDAERESLEDISQDDIAPLSELSQQVNEFLSQMLPLEAISAPLRKAIRPFRQGAIATKNAADIMRRWPEIADE